MKRSYDLIFITKEACLHVQKVLGRRFWLGSTNLHRGAELEAAYSHSSVKEQGVHSGREIWALT